MREYYIFLRRLIRRNLVTTVFFEVAFLAILSLGMMSVSPAAQHNIAAILNRGQGVGHSSKVSGLKDGDNTIGTLNAAKDGKGSQATSSQSTSSTASSQRTIPSKPVIRYSTSPDPRSTAYSLTPPKPSADDFMHFVTHNGEYAPGTIIVQDVEKYDLKVYYGGDLVVNPSSVTISELNGNTLSQPFTISTPDGTTTNEPTEPANDYSSIADAVTRTAQGEGTSWTMYIDAYGHPAPSVQPYMLHLQTTRGVGDDDWEYDVFIPFYVTN